MVRRRHNLFESLETVDQTRWLVVSSITGRIVGWMEFGPRENLKRRFAEAVAASYAAGWEVESFSSQLSFFFCHRESERRCVGIYPSPPKDRSGLWPVPEKAGSVGSCVDS